MDRSLRIAAVKIMFFLLIACSCREGLENLPPDIDSDLLAYYHLDGNGNDASGNNRNAVLYSVNATADNKGNSNGACMFDGSTSWIDVPALPVSADLTVSFWMKTQATSWSIFPWSMFIIDRDLAGANRDWSICNGQDGFLEFNTGSSYDYTMISTDTINGGQWLHVAVVRDSSAKLKSIYIDGIVNATEEFDDQPFVNQDSNICIGCSRVDKANHLFYEGALDNVRFYSRALSAFDIDSLYKAEK
ncbi:MAG TPA: LamG domain-containing protein [bacterium]